MYQFHCQEAFSGISRLSLNSGKVYTKSAVPPGSTVVGRESLTSGACLIKIAKEGDVEMRSGVLFSTLKTHVIGH